MTSSVHGSTRQHTATHCELRTVVRACAMLRLRVHAYTRANPQLLANWFGKKTFQKVRST